MRYILVILGLLAVLALVLYAIDMLGERSAAGIGVSLFVLLGLGSLVKIYSDDAAARKRKVWPYGPCYKGERRSSSTSEKFG